MKNLLNFTLALTVLIFISLGCTQADKPVASNMKVVDAPATGSQTVTETPAEKPIVINAKSLSKEYDENELAADGKYKGKTLEVTGKISNIADTMGNLTVQLEGHQMFKTVMCTFDQSEKENLMKLKKGQNATFIGTGDGSTGGLYAGLKGCKIK